MIRQSVDTTYNLETLVMPGPVYRSSWLSGHALKAETHGPVARHNFQPDWMTGILIFCFLLLAWNHVFYPKRLIQVFKAPFSRRFINQLVREGNLFNERIAFTLVIVYGLAFSLLVFVMNEIVFQLNIP